MSTRNRFRPPTHYSCTLPRASVLYTVVMITLFPRSFKRLFSPFHDPSTLACILVLIFDYYYDPILLFARSIGNLPAPFLYKLRLPLLRDVFIPRPFKRVTPCSSRPFFSFARILLHVHTTTTYGVSIWQIMMILRVSVALASFPPVHF
jgi:hypothetical protein